MPLSNVMIIYQSQVTLLLEQLELYKLENMACLDASVIHSKQAGRILDRHSFHCQHALAG
jgi:hypothetical protein